jgi:hypothetical protein
MTGLRSRAWRGLAALTGLLILFGIGDIALGIEADPGIPVGLTGLTPAALAADSAAGHRLVDFGARAGGLHLVVMGALALVVVLIPFRRGERWAWWAMWSLPAWAAGVFLLNVAYGVAPGHPPPPPMVSGPIFAVVAAALLLVTAPRFFPGNGEERW